MHRNDGSHSNLIPRKGEAMGICHFCKGKFQSEQAVKSHMKRCDLYQADKRKKSAALGGVPKAVVTSPPIKPNPSGAAPDLTAPLHDLMKSISELSSKQAMPQTPQQQHRAILQAVKVQVIDHNQTSLGHVTAALRGDGKMAIERELATLPLDELGFDEACEFATAIRDRLYAVAFRSQARETDRQRVEAESRQQKERDALAALIRADRRKKIFLQQASQQAHAFCLEKKITRWAHLSVLADVESRLNAFLSGDELIMEAQAIVRSVLDARFAEAEATLAAAREKANEQWREEIEAVLVLGALVGLVVLSLHYPAQTVAIFNWIKRIFGYAPGAEACAPNPEASKTTPPAASTELRPPSKRRRKDPVSPSSPELLWGNPVGGEPGHA